MNLPFPRSYWVVPGKLLAGAYPGSTDPAASAAKLDGLIAAGVTLVISLMHATERNHGGHAFISYEAALSGVDCRRFPIVDGSIPTEKTMVSVLDAIDAGIAAGGIVYVHCWGGRGRTGTVVCCWLIRHGLSVSDQAVDRLQELIQHNAAAFYPTPETKEQKEFVRSWRSDR